MSDNKQLCSYCHSPVSATHNCKDMRNALERQRIPAINRKALTPARGEPMPRTIEHYQASALRDQELILEQKDEISKLKQKVNNLEQGADQYKALLTKIHDILEYGDVYQWDGGEECWGEMRAIAIKLQGAKS